MGPAWPPFTQVYLIRHGIAAERGTHLDDAQRPLIQKGINKTEKVARRLVTLGLCFDTLLTSPLVRAVQTTELLCENGLAREYQLFSPLAPGGSIHDWLDWLKSWQSPEHSTLALVGHEPDLSHWAQQLVHGAGDRTWILKKAGVIGVDVPKAEHALGHSQLFWLAPPRLLL